MLKAVTIALVLCGAMAAQQIKKVAVQPTLAGDGPAMFKEYCATCHGVEGRGNGPAMNATKKRPADLTQLARKNGGTFPDVHVMNYITGYDVVAAHGTRDMPVWGTLFRSLDPDSEGVAKLRVKVLAEYIKTLQAQ
ncbi:MAG TPA: c-type cytochrome [Bryobacteraceae bacterium]|jgi:mono/diheme cytochrome c family protein